MASEQDDWILSDVYEQTALSKKRNRIFSNVLFGTLPAIGIGNYVIADERITSPYVWGSIVLGPVFKLGSMALDKVVDKVLQDRIEEHFIAKFSNDEDDL